MKIGAQLYTVRDFCQTEGDLACSLEKIAKMGYTTVQVSGIGKIDPLRLRELCDENGLSIVLTHNDPNRIINDTDRLIEEHNILGCDYIGLGAMPPKYQNFFWVEHFARDFREPAKKIAAAGKLLMYHNHNFEFEKGPDGRRLIEILMDDMAARGDGLYPGHLLGAGGRRRCLRVAGAAEGASSLRTFKGYGG